MASVVFDKVRKAYGTIEVVHGIDLAIEDGAFVVLLGPSGCGKSTLLRMIAGLETVSGGDIRIGERNVTHLAPKDRNIAMVFQNYALYPHMSVADNMSFALKRADVPKAEIASKIAGAARILGLDSLLSRLPRQLSGGQRQRVAMGRAIVRDPAVFLFDEPLSNLDAKLRVQMRTEIKELHQRLGTTTVFVTHDQIEAMTMADTIVILRDGRIEQAGHPLAVYDNPANLFVAGFIGSPGMNVVAGTVEMQANAPVIRTAGATLALPARAAAMVGQAVSYGIRPEHLRPVANDTGLVGTIMTVEPTGPETHVYVRLAGQELCAITQERLPLRPGAPVNLVAAAEHVHLFDAASGIRL